MGYQSKTYSLSDEVVAAIDRARASGETPNRYLQRLIRMEQTALATWSNGSDQRQPEIKELTYEREE